jgi:hypothetical protein
LNLSKKKTLPKSALKESSFTPVVESEEVSEAKSKTPSAPTPAAAPPQYVRPPVVKYITAQEYLLRKGVKPHHIPVYVSKAKSLGWTKATASDWEKLLFGES